MINSKPFLRCRKVHSVNLNDWNSIDAIFKDAKFVHFQQGWADNPAVDHGKLTAAILDGHCLTTSGSEGIRAVELICTVYESARMGRAIKLS